jgi:hypothetical protein
VCKSDIREILLVWSLFAGHSLSLSLFQPTTPRAYTCSTKVCLNPKPKATSSLRPSEICRAIRAYTCSTFYLKKGTSAAARPKLDSYQSTKCVCVCVCVLHVFMHLKASYTRSFRPHTLEADKIYVAMYRTHTRNSGKTKRQRVII